MDSSTDRHRRQRTFDADGVVEPGPQTRFQGALYSAREPEEKSKGEASGGTGTDWAWAGGELLAAAEAGQSVLTKLDATGSSVLYLISLGWYDTAAIKLDSSGNVCEYKRSTDATTSV